jgi:aryl-alcohol dehydrogenase
VGLSAVMAARLAGAAVIIAVDVVASRLDLAKELGATHVINSRELDPFARIAQIAGIGVHYALDTTGRIEIIRGAIGALRPGGTCGVLGAAPPNSELAFDYNLFMGSSKVVRGIVEGDSIPEIFIPRLIALYLQGRFPFDRLVKFYSLEQINEALADSEKGLVVKPVIRMPATEVAVR